VSSFDNFGQALLAVIQALTIEQWSALMYNESDGYSSLFTQIYFCLVVILGHYYMLQFLLAVIMTNLTKIQSAEAFEEIQLKHEQVLKDKQYVEQQRQRVS
jgi:hypothetical protein